MEHHQVFNFSSITTDNLTIAYNGIFNYNDTTHNIYISVLDDQNRTFIENTSISDKKVSPTIPNESTLKAKIKFDYNNNLKIDTNNLIETWVFYSDTYLHYTSYDGNSIMTQNETILVTKDTTQIDIPKNKLTSYSIYAYSTYLYLEFYLKTGTDTNYTIDKFRESWIKPGFWFGSNRAPEGAGTAYKFILRKLPFPQKITVGRSCGVVGKNTDLHQLETGNGSLSWYQVSNPTEYSTYFGRTTPTCGGYFYKNYIVNKKPTLSTYDGYGPTGSEIQVRTRLFDEEADGTRTEYLQGYCPQRANCRDSF